jgi:DNA-directed RNA polymerase subunit RPC12/RpoP
MFCPVCYCELIVPYIDAAYAEVVESKMDADEVYDLHRSGVFKVYDGIPVYCKLCRTLMYASEDQIGSELTCPDCGVKTIVVKL